MKDTRLRVSPLKIGGRHHRYLPSLPTPQLSPLESPRQESLTYMSNNELRENLKKLRNQDSLSAEDMIPVWLLERSEFIETCKEYDNIPNLSIFSIISKAPSERSDVEKVALSRWYKKQFYLKGMPERVKKRVSDQLEVVCFLKGTCFAKDLPIEKISIIVTGTVRINNSLIGAPNLLDDVDLILNRPRKEDIVAETDVELLQMNKEDFKEYLYAGRRANIRELYEAISKFNRISSWPKSRIQTMASHFYLFQFNKGETIYEYGSHPDFLYIVWTGLVSTDLTFSIRKKNLLPVGKNTSELLEISERHKTSFKNYKPYEMLGEVEAFYGLRRGVRAVAMKDMTMLFALPANEIDFFFSLVDKELISGGNTSTIDKNRVEQKMRNDIIGKKKNFKALLAANNIRSLPKGRDLFGEYSRKKNKYAHEIYKRFRLDISKSLLQKDFSLRK